jgi:hypothetical protein
MRSFRLLLLLASAGIALSGTAIAADPTATSPAAERERANAELRQKMQSINEQQRELLEKMAEMDVQRRELELMLLKVEDPDAYRGGQDTSEAPPSDTPVVGAEQKAEKEESESFAPEIPRVSFDVGGVLTPKGRLVLEPSFEYVYSAVDKVSIEGFAILPALLIGVIDVFEADRDTYIAALSARYGITNRWEVEMRAPYLWRRDTTRSREFLQGQGGTDVQESSRSASGEDIGDIELGIRYQFPRLANWPYFTGNLRIKADNGTDPFELAARASLSGTPENIDDLPTGSGFWSLNPSVTFIYPSDPVVFFGNLGYLYTVEDDKGIGPLVTPPPPATEPVPAYAFGDVDPGDALRFNFGMGFSLNDRSSFSLSYSLDVFDKTEIEFAREKKVAGSDVTVGKFLIGYSLRLPTGSPLNLSIGIGATEDAPDSDITFRMPFNFLN